LGYAYGTHAPGISAPAVLPYQCAHTVIKSHGLAYRIYDAEFRATQNGQVGITLDAGWPEPIDDTNQADLEASEREMQFKYGWFAYPLTHGVYPPIMRQLIDAKSEAEGREESRLPSFDVGWTYIINGTLDFYGLNHYSSHYVFPSTGGSPGWDGDKDTAGCSDPSWPPSAASWLNVVPWGFRKILRWIGNEFGNKPIYVTENGFADRDVDGLNDVGRQNYYNLYINEMMKAVNVDGVNVKGYTAWSLIDNFEWAEGYTQRFGVHHIQFNDPRRTRWPKDSALLLTKIFRENGFPNPKANARNKY
jgi:lactase-phlorizin hydrolase